MAQLTEKARADKPGAFNEYTLDLQYHDRIRVEVNGHFAAYIRAKDLTKGGIIASGTVEVI